MPDRLYFILGDLGANGLTGILAGLLCHWLIGPGWSMWLAMPVGMILGMVVAALLALLLLMRYFGAMEVMLPVMLTGMLAGMWIGMRAAMAPLAGIDVVAYGVLCGVAVLALCWAANAQLRGKRTDA